MRTNRIIAADIEDAIAAAKNAPALAKQEPVVEVKKVATPAKVDMPNNLFIDTEVSQIRKIIAERLSFSKQNIPHYYVTISVSVDKLLALRARLNNVATSKISVNDLVMKAASMAALKVPQTNSSW